MDKKVILTVQGLEKIKAELDQLVKIGLPDAEEKLELAIKNNGDVQDATAYREFCRDRIANLGEMLCAAKVLPEKSPDKRWISVNDKLPETKQRVLARFETTFKDKQIPHVTIADYIAPRSVLESDYMDEQYATYGDYDEEKDCYWTETGWYESSHEAEVNWRLSEEVTHWMPLPSVKIEDRGLRASFPGRDIHGLQTIHGRLKSSAHGRTGSDRGHAGRRHSQSR